MSRKRSSIAHELERQYPIEVVTAVSIEAVLPYLPCPVYV
jgi:hypothetical protein